MMKNEKKKFMTSREMKKAALHTLKHHYALLVMVCLLAALLHTRYTDAFNRIQNVITGNSEGVISDVQAELASDNEPVSTGMLGNQTATSVLTSMLLEGVERGDELSQ